MRPCGRRLCTVALNVNNFSETGLKLSMNSKLLQKQKQRLYPGISVQDIHGEKRRVTKASRLQSRRNFYDVWARRL